MIADDPPKPQTRQFLFLAAGLLLAVIFMPNWGAAQAQTRDAGLCTVSCGNMCRDPGCFSMCISRCSAPGGATYGPRQAYHPSRSAALAETPDRAFWGVSVGNPTDQDARNDALIRCETLAKRHCQLVGDTYGLNVAVLEEIENGTTIGLIIKSGDTMADAINPMVAWCRQHHPHAQCNIVYQHR